MSATTRNTDADRLVASTGLIDIDAIATMIGASRSTLYRLIASGEFPKPAIRIHRRLCRWNPRDVERWIAKGGAPGPAPAAKPKAAPLPVT